ncbi:hypothetical protein JOB18_048145 [Solea senegalensis]|uniref:Uncharacterized protein n=1 Tax=Solea senegalensis TaxID=28829 RepID=A0AAV6TCB8_SOLSE|nr:hypothetical protein JOB18_048145 [Solea senegalensis]
MGSVSTLFNTSLFTLYDTRRRFTAAFGALKHVLLCGSSKGKFRCGTYKSLFRGVLLGLTVKGLSSESPTDTVLGLLSELRLDLDRHTLLFGKSILNDGGCHRPDTVSEALWL